MQLRQLHPTGPPTLEPEPVALTPLLVSADEAADVLGIGRTTFFAIVRDGLIPQVRIKGCVRYETADLHALIASLKSDDLLKAAS